MPVSAIGLSAGFRSYDPDALPLAYSPEAPIAILHASDGFFLGEFPTRNVRIQASHIPYTLITMAELGDAEANRSTRDAADCPKARSVSIP
jgi:hypothetical protein